MTPDRVNLFFPDLALCTSTVVLAHKASFEALSAVAEIRTCVNTLLALLCPYRYVHSSFNVPSNIYPNATFPRESFVQALALRQQHAMSILHVQKELIFNLGGFIWLGLAETSIQTAGSENHLASREPSSAAQI